MSIKQVQCETKEEIEEEALLWLSKKKTGACASQAPNTM